MFDLSRHNICSRDFVMKESNKAIITLLIICSFICNSSSLWAQDENPSASGLLLSLINQLREQPLVVMKANGLSPTVLIKEVPELAASLRDGMAPLALNEQLGAAAESHLDDMISSGYYGSESPDGLLPYDRILAQGYLPLQARETLAMLGFRNFVDPSRAVEIIFQNILRDELARTSFNELTILNPELTEIGIGFGSGTVKSGTLVYNYYLSVCDMATNVLSEVEQEVLRQVNAARTDPLQYAEMAGILGEEELSEPGEYPDVLTTSLSPVRPDEVLVETAALFAEDILEDFEAADIRFDAETLTGWFEENGYLFAGVDGVYRMLITVDPVDPLDGALFHVKKLFARELDLAPEQRKLLNGNFDLVGIRLIARESGDWYSDSDQASPHYNLMLMLIFAAQEK